MEQATAAARASLWRTALVFAPLFLLSLGGMVVIIVNLALEGASGLIVTLVLLTLAALLTGHQAIQSIRDLLSPPKETTGPIRRRWSRADAIVIRSYYIHVEGGVYKVDPAIYLELKEGDPVTITHYPHTNTVIAVEVHRE